MRIFFSCLIFSLLFSLWLFLFPAAAQDRDDAGFDAGFVHNWVAGFRQEAIGKGVSGDFFDRAFADFRPLAKVIRAANYQPEDITPPEDYVRRLVSDERIEEGRLRLSQHIDLLENLERVYGVDRHILVAIWGVESNYGQITGRYNIIHALATLALEGRRTKFARRQLLALLPVLEKEKMPPAITGSWAGAMGHMQFIPTTYVDYAVDHNGDGRRDIWHNLPDSLGSAANYLKASGWTAGLFWGVEVQLPEGFDIKKHNAKTERSLREWLDAGYVLTAGQDARMAIWQEKPARLLLPKQKKNPAFLVTKNFDALLKYNHSDIYVLAVGHLADRLRGAGQAAMAWTRPALKKENLDEALTRDEIRKAQHLLNQLGFAAGAADGITGAKTRKALRKWQKRIGVAMDGILSRPNFERISRAALSLSYDEIRLLQQKLADRGFDPGAIDGLMGRKTRTALRRWQKNSGLPVDGHPDHDILAALGEAEAALE